MMFYHTLCSTLLIRLETSLSRGCLPSVSESPPSDFNCASVRLRWRGPKPASNAACSRSLLRPEPESCWSQWPSKYRLIVDSSCSLLPLPREFEHPCSCCSVDKLASRVLPGVATSQPRWSRWHECFLDRDDGLGFALQVAVSDRKLILVSTCCTNQRHRAI